MHLQDPVFERIEAAIHALDATTDTQIKSVDERLRALGVAVEVYLKEPVNVSGDSRLHLGYVRLGDTFTLAVKRVAPSAEASVQPLQSTDRVTRLAAVDRLPTLLGALETALSRRNAQIAQPEPAAAPPPVEVVVQSVPPEPKAEPRAEPKAESKAEPKAEPKSKPELVAPPAGAADLPLRAVPAADATPESVDHMFRLFSRKSR